MKCCIVKRDVNLSSVIKLLLVPLITVVLSLVAPRLLFFPVIIIGFIIFLWLTPALLMTEYEYNLEGETFSVSLIKAKSSRKEIFACDIDCLLSCAPFNNQVISGTKVDVSVKANSPYIATFSAEGKTTSVIFSPDEDFVRELRLLAPSKVKLNIL